VAVINMNNTSLTIEQSLKSAIKVNGEGDYEGAVIMLIGRGGENPIFVTRGTPIDPAMTALYMAQRALIESILEA